MGLSIYLLAECNDRVRREEISLINRVLKEHQLPFHDEPPLRLIKEDDFPAIEWLYSTSEGLELLAAKFVEDPDWELPNNREGYFPISTVSHRKILQNSQSHIICLPKDAGYYIPLQFQPSLLHSCPRIGSSITFHDELKELAKRLHFDLGKHTTNLRILHEERRSELEADPFEPEKWVLLCLYNLSVASVRYKSTIVFAG